MIPGMYSNDWDPNDPQGSAMSYAPAKTPAPAPPPQQPTQPSPDTGGTQQGIKDQWSEFMGRPETRAGLMQFAVNMLSGRGLGESIGGAAAATGRNVAAQEEEQKYEEAQALKQQELDIKRSEAESYGIGQRKKSGSDVFYEHEDARQQAAARAAGEKSYSDWRKDPIDTEGYLKAVQKRYPQIKSKADLADPSNAAAEAYAHDLVAGTRSGAGRAAAPAPNLQPVYDKKTGALKGYWDGKKYTPGGPD